ncbi:F-box/kelch-repeat protein At3g23880-like [Amaranthus tricolor]|uniref:F-box/kelch-repeat protein At3g23880-like n=1 Tax=Amaranthus tricolor TaxID=29722 RepID=UPI00258F5183|nr:F-box/kelch-repeat protein At3g23880-like [Amaranthus tricolor]
MILTCERTKVLEDKYLIPDVLWMEVLAYLPTKTLLQIRCVCKTWCSLIDSHYFTYRHLEFYNGNKRNNSRFNIYAFYGRLIRSVQNSFIIYQSDNNYKNHISCIPDHDMFNRFYHETDMVNGLMLVRRERFWIQDEQLFLWNPSIYKLLEIPPCPLTKTYSKLDFHFCLGFVPSSYDYRVLVFREDKKGERLEVEMAIYSLRENRWKVKPNWVNVLGRSLALTKNYDSGVYTHDNVVYSQGVVYWKPTLLCNGKNLVYFDFEDETFGIKELPIVLDDDYLKIVFILSGSLAVFGISYSEICIWVIDKDNNVEKAKQQWCQNLIRDSTVKPLEKAYTQDCGILKVNNAGKPKQQWCQYLVRDSTVKPREGACAGARGIFAVIDKHHNIVYDERNHTFLACYDDQLKSYNIETTEVQHLTNSHKISYFGTYMESLVLLNQAKLKR